MAVDIIIGDKVMATAIKAIPTLHGKEAKKFLCQPFSCGNVSTINQEAYPSWKASTISTPVGMSKLCPYVLMFCKICICEEHCLIFFSIFAATIDL